MFMPVVLTILTRN